jgi:orotate phosphoribosyltransferase
MNQDDSPAAGLRRKVIELIRELGLERRDEPFQLSSGDWSRDYVDGKRAIASGENLKLVGEAISATAAEAGIAFDAVGGLTMGADPLSHAVSIVSGKPWFSVRKEPKKHGTRSRIEGAQLDVTTRVLLVEDVVTTGRSILDAHQAVIEAGAQIAGAITLVDRGEAARRHLESLGVTYRPLATYSDLEIDPVGS